jgi:hypothetical protein
MLGRMLQQHVNPVLLDGIHQQKRVVGANQDLELAELVSRWRDCAKHDPRIGGCQGSVKLV